jgi:porin
VARRETGLSNEASTLGAGVVVLPTADPNTAIVKFSVVSASGNAATAGFDELSSDNLVFGGEGRVRTHLFDLTGHHLVGALYSNAEYTSVDQRLGFATENQRLEPKRDTWAVYYNFDQMLHEVDASAGRGIGNSAKRGIGVFGRFGAAAGNPNPVQYFGSVGLGGQGLSASRPLDRFGAGLYYSNINEVTFDRPVGTSSFLGDEWGGELFYNIAIRPWMLLTPDLQVIEPSQRERRVGPGRRESVKVATVLGLRLQLIF